MDSPSKAFPLHLVVYRTRAGKFKIGSARRDRSNGMWFAEEIPGAAEVIKDLGALQDDDLGPVKVGDL